MELGMVTEVSGAATVAPASHGGGVKYASRAGQSARDSIPRRAPTLGPTDERIVAFGRKALSLAAPFVPTLGPVSADADELCVRVVLRHLKKLHDHDGVLDDDAAANALVHFVAAAEAFRENDMRATVALGISSQTRHHLVLQARTVPDGFGGYASVGADFATLVHPTMGEVVRLTARGICGSSEERITLSEWSPGALSFAQGFCEVQRPGALRVPAMERLGALRIAMELVESMQGRLHCDDDTLQSIFASYIESRNVAMDCGTRPGETGDDEADDLPRDRARG
jgi:hypothetical protein